MSEITFKNFSIFYKEKKDIITAVDEVSFSFHNEKINVLIGFSGCGKTSILNAISGKIIYDGELFIGDKNIEHIAVQKRGLAYVSQEFVLYPHMTVYDNIAYPLRIMKLPREEIDYRVRSVSGAIDISFLLTRKPKYLSIGQQQRVAIARAFVKKPDIILMDEPLSNLDKETSEEIRVLIKQLVKDNKTTCVYVSHNINDAVSLADYIYVMNQGKIIGEFTPDEFLDSHDPVVEALKLDLPHEEESK